MSFRFEVLRPGDPYFAQWADRRQRTLTFWIAFGLGAHVALFLSLVAWWAAVPLFAVLFGLRLWQVAWPCPRCGKPFYATWWRQSGLADACLHCGLLEYAPHGDALAGRRPLERNSP